LGVGLGLALAVLAVAYPVAGVSILLLVIGVELVLGLLPRVRPLRLALASGALIGSGIALTYGTANTYGACLQTANFCGNANLVPLAASALVAIVAGVLVGIAATRHHA
jgi:hypothetical protein